MTSRRDPTERAEVWLLQDGEPLPLDSAVRVMRTGDLARRLVAAGYAVRWWSSRFDHVRKRFRTEPGLWHSMEQDYRIGLLDGPGYSRNLSWKRVRHQRHVATHFGRLAPALPPPALIVASYPSPELCEAGAMYARRHGVPFVIDIRDPWPDMFGGYLPRGVRWSLAPLLWHYHRKIRRAAGTADAVIAVSEAMLDWAVRHAGRIRRATDRVFHIGFTRPAVPSSIDVPERFTAAQPLVCVFASSCGRSYNGEALIDAARLLEAAGERRVRVVIIGDGEMRARWGARAAGLGSVQFTGWVDHHELLEHYARAHVGAVLMRGGVVPFWLGNKVFEYLAASLCLLNDVPAEAADIVTSRGVGVNVGSGDAPALATALSDLADSPSRVRAYKARAREVFAEEFDRERIQSGYVQFLADVLASRPAAPSDTQPGRLSR